MKVRIALFLLLLGVFSCKKKDEQQPVYIKQTLKDWFDYRAGSYWVFYDSLNNEVDSLYVMYNLRNAPFKNSSEAREQVQETGYFYDKATDKVKSKWDMEILASSFFELSINPYQSVSQGLSHELVAGVPFEPKTTNHRECALLTEYSVNGQSFKNVYRIRLHDTAYGSYHDNVYYIDKDAGFISIIHNSTAFKQRLYLIRHNVLK